MGQGRFQRLRKIGAKLRSVGRVFKAKLGHGRRRVGRWFRFHVESATFLTFLVLLFLLFLFRAFGYFSFQSGNNILILATLVELLATIFAFVFTFLAGPIERYSEEQSKLFVRIYFSNWRFIIPFALNFIALVVNLFLFVHTPFQHLTDYGILLSFAVISLLPFLFIFTFRFLMIETVVDMLLHRLKVNPRLLSKNFAEESLYRKHLQPIEDTILRNVELGRYTIVFDLIDRIREKMDSALLAVKRRMREEDGMTQLVVYMSTPFARLFEAVAVYANKKDAIEITVYIIRTIAGFVEQLDDARFQPSFQIFDQVIERIHSQAVHRFSRPEYAVDLAKLEIAIARSRVSISRFMR